MSSTEPRFTAHVDMGSDGVIRRILVQYPTKAKEWFTLVIDIKPDDIEVYDGEAEE